MTNRLFDELFIIEINKVADCVRAGLLILSSTFVGELNFSSAVIIIKSFIYLLISFLSWRHGEKRFHTHVGDVLRSSWNCRLFFFFAPDAVEGDGNLRNVQPNLFSTF